MNKSGKTFQLENIFEAIDKYGIDNLYDSIEPGSFIPIKEYNFFINKRHVYVKINDDEYFGFILKEGFNWDGNSKEVSLTGY